MHPTQVHYVCYSWFGRLFQDLRTPFGLRPSPEFFCRITAIIRLIMLAKGLVGVLVYVDDFFMVGKTMKECETVFEVLFGLLEELGLPTKESKCKRANQTMK